MNYKDTILKDIDWKSNLEVKHDKSNDIKINIPLDKMLDLQAKKAFVFGILEGLAFIRHASKNIRLNEQFEAKMKEWGLK